MALGCVHLRTQVERAADACDDRDRSETILLGSDEPPLFLHSVSPQSLHRWMINLSMAHPDLIGMDLQ
jgi:hypothetical protein